MSDEIAAAVKQAQILERALSKATTDRGVSFRALNSELQKAGTTASEMVATLAQAGPAFAGSLDSFLGAFATADRNLIGISKKIKEMQRVMTQSIKFTAAAQIQQFVASQVQEAISWVKELNSELNTIAIVSGKSAEAMNKVYESVIRNAKQLRVAADDYAYAAQIFYQQGLGDEEVERRSQITIKAAQAAGQSTQEMSQQLTAVWNTYNMQGEQLERAASVGARMGAETAVEFKDIATAMQISASAAAQMNVEYDMLASIIATVGDTTQQSASVIGNAYKTIFSRFDQLVSSGTDGEVTLGRVSQQLADLGVNILDANGDLIPLGDTILDLGNRWEEYSQKQQIALAEAIGGTRQFGQVLALFNNWDKFMANYESAKSEVGAETLEAQYLTSLDSIESAATNASEAWSRAFSNIFQEESLKGFYNGLETVGETLDGILEGFGGLPGILALVGAYMSRHLITGITKVKNEWTNFQNNLTVDRQIETARLELTKMSDEIKKIHFTGVTSSSPQNVQQTAISNNAYDQTKLNVTQQVTEATIKLSQIEKTANQETKNKVQWLREALSLTQQNANEAVNILKNERDLAKSQEIVINGMKRRVEYLRTQASLSVDNADAHEAEADQLENLANLTSDLNDIRISSNDISTEGVEKLSGSVGKLSQTVKNIPELKGFSSELEAIGKNIGTGGTEGLTGNLGDLHETLTAMISSIDGNDAASKRMRQTLQQYQAQLGTTITAQTQLKSALADTTNFAGQVSAAYQLSGMSLKNFNQLLMTSISSISMTAMSFSALARTIESGDASFGSIIIQLGFLVPQLVNTIKMMKELGSTFVAAMAKLGAQTIATKAQAVAEEALTKALNDQAIAQERLNRAKAQGQRKSAIKGLENKLKAADSAVDTAKANVEAAKGQVANAANAPITGKNVMTGLGKTASQAGQKILGILSKIPPQAYIAAAAIAAIALAYNEWEKTTAEAKMERMAKAASKLKEEADEAAQTADNLRSTIESYDSAVDALNSCVKGTEEWNDALKKVNESALEVIDSLDFMSLTADQIDDLYSYEDGVLTFNQEALESAQKAADAKAAKAQYASSMAQADLADLQRQVNTKNDIRAIKGNSEMGIGAGAATGAAIGTAVGSIIPGLGNAIGLAIGAGVGAIAGGIAGNNIGMNVESEKAMQALYDNIDKLSNKTGNELVEELTRLGFSSIEVTKNLGEYTKIIGEVSTATQAYEAQIRATTAASVETQLGDDFDSTTKAAVTEQVIAAQNNIEEDLNSWIDDSFNKADWLNTAGAEEELISRYNAAAGVNYRADGNFSRGTDNNRTFAFKDETGELVELTKEQVVSTIAASEALQDLGATAEETATMLARLDAGTEGATDAIRDFVTNRNLDTATMGEFNQIKEKAEEAGGAKEYLISIGFNEDLAEQYAADFEAALDIDWASVTAKLPESFKEAEDLSLSQARGFGETYQKIIGIAGEGAGKEYEGMITGILNGITDPEMQDQARDILAGIDWTQWDAADQAADALAGIGVELDTGSQSWQNFEASMRSTFKAIPDIKALAESINNVKSISEGLELGSIISYEDYQTLVNFNSELGKYFTILADGSAQMTGDLLDFMQEVQATEQEKLKEQIKAAEDMAKELQGVSGSQNYQGTNGENYYRGSNVQTQLDYIQAYGGADQAQIDKWREDLEDGKSTVETIDAIGAAFDELGMSAETAGNTAQTAMTQLAMTAGSAEERLEMLTPGEDGVKEINESAYGAAAMAAINQEKWEGLDVEEVQNYSDHLQDLAENSELVDKNLKDDAETAEEVARAVMKTNDGIEKLSEGFEDWSDILENSDESSEEYCEALSGMKNALSDVLGVSEEFIDNDFIKENMEDIAKAAEGDAEAIDNLRAALAEDLILDLTVDGSTAEQQALQAHADLTAKLAGKKVGFTVTADMDSTGILTAAQGVVNSARMSVEEAQAYFNSLGYEPVFEMTEQTVQSKKPITETYTQDNGTSYETYETVNPDGSVSTQTVPFVRTRSFSKIVGYTTQDEVMQVPAISADGTPKITELKKINSGSMNNFSGSNAGGGSPGGGSKGGGGSAPKHQAIKAKKYESMKKDDRYSTIKASIEEVQRSLDKYNDAVDDSWGSAKIRALQQANRELERQAKDYQALYKSAKSYLSIDQKEAAKNKKDLGKKLGLNLIDPTFNKDGFLSNKTEVINQLDDYLQALYQKYYDAAQKYDADKSTDEKRKEQIDQMLEEYNVAKEAVDEYITSLDQVDETANEAYEALMKLVEGIRQEIANRVEEITYKMEFRIKINDRDIEWFEHIIDKMGDVGLITGKSFEQIVKSFNSSASSIQTAADTFGELQNLLASLNTKEGQQDFITKFGQKAWDYYLATGKLSAEVIEGMSDVYDQAFDALNQAYDDFDAMFEQYLSLLDIYLSEFDRFSNQISRQSDQLEAYRQLLDFSGKGYGEDGRAARKSLSDAQISNAKTELARAQSVAKMLEGSVKDSEERLQKFYDTYGKDPSGWDTATAHAFNQIKQTHDEIVSQYEDAQSDITAALTDVIDAATEALEDGHERITEAFVEGFNGLFTSLDSALTQYEWKTDIRDFYLDDYDKNYELDKLLGEIDDAMTDVTDPERLQAWGALQDEINAKMAEGVKITQTDLDILRAQFELEQAKDQYEEAKNAKNTMRLARDASGNWNYVYSSESSEAEDAEQKMKDAMANIHKMHREAADSMSDLWYQTYIEMWKYEYEVDQLRYKNDEQYRAEVDEFRRLYKEKLDFYESEVIKHNGAIDRSFADTVLGQQTGYETMEEAANAYYQANEQYTKELQDNANEYEETIRETCDRVGISYEELEQWIRDRANNIMQSNDDIAEKMEETSIRGSTALGNLSDNIDTYAWSMIESLRALELQVESLYNTLQNLSNWEADVGMNADFGTDYTDYIGTDFYNKYGKDATANDVKDYMNSAEVQQLIKERLYVMQNDPNRGDLHDPKAVYENVYNEVYNSLMAILKDIQNDKGYWTDDNWDFGKNGSAKKKRTASGGLIKTPQVRSLAEEGPELVLNKDDTQNILEAVKNMRETIKLKISAMNSSIGQKVQGETIATQSNVETIEQNVKIDATFPGVSVASEIEEALNNLINQAVQYAHKNNR